MVGVLHAVAELMSGGLHGCGVMHLHLRPRTEERFDQHQRRTLAHIIRFGLECQAPYRDGALVQIAKVPTQLGEQDLLLGLIGRLDRLEDVEIHAALGGRANQRLDVLREARSPVAWPRKQERRPDAPVAADATAHMRHIRSHGLAQAGNLIHEGDPGREHRIGRVFRHLRRRDVHHDERIAGAHERCVQLLDHARGLVRVHADDDTIGLHEVLDRRPFLQEFRVGADVERRARVARDFRANFFGRPHRHRALGDDDLGLVHVLADRARHLENVLQVGGAVLVGRRPDGDEHDLRALDGLRNVGREGEPAFALVADHHRLEARLVDRNFVLLERPDLRRIDVRANHVVAGLGEARAHDEADVPRPDNRYPHARPPLSSRGRT